MRRNKPVRFMLHARQRMDQRIVSRQEIEAALRNPDLITPARSLGRLRVLKVFGGRKLNVIYYELPKEYMVLTVWWTRT